MKKSKYWRLWAASSLAFGVSLAGLTSCATAPDQKQSRTVQLQFQLEAIKGRLARSPMANSAILADFKATAESEFKLGEYIAKNTAAGKNPHLSFTQELIAILEELVQTGEPPPAVVTTRISVAQCQTCTIYYLPYADREKGSQNWQSYSHGMALPPMTYIFRVNGLGETFEEPVPIWRNPTARVINNPQ